MTRLGSRAREGAQVVASNAAFRLRLLRMALSPMSRIPAGLVMALGAPDYDYSPADERVAVR